MNIAIVGAGTGGNNIIKCLNGTKNINISLIIDKNPKAPGILLGKQLGIKCSSSMEDIRVHNIDLIIEATGSEKVSNALYNDYCSTCKIIDSTGALLIITLVEKLNNQIHVINDTSSVVQDQLKEISSSIKNIDTVSDGLLDSTEKSNGYIAESDKIIQYVNKIANQTKILGINATIEASRAGEHGKGFSVVANEVQKLADNSESFAKEINDLLIKLSEEIKQINKEADKLKNLSKIQIDASNDAHLAVKKLMDETNK